MSLTALQAQGEGLGAAAVAEYRGADSALRFRDPQDEFAALHTGCGVYDLGFRSKISLAGADRARWLNGMVTNNIRDLAVNHGVYAFLLNPQGHILGDLFAYNRDQSITVDTDRSQAEKILATFDHYIIMDDVEVNLREDLTSLGISGPKSGEVLAHAELVVPQMSALQLDSVSWRGIDTTLVRGENGNSYEIWLPSASVRQLWDALLSAGAAPVGSEALEMARIESGVPRYGIDIRERDLPQETEQARALNFNKGCYVGQEIVERIRSRGAVHRKFSGLVTNSVEQVMPGTKILAGEKEIGEITSSTILHLPSGIRNVALGYIRREMGSPGREVMIGSTAAKVATLPFTDAAEWSAVEALHQRGA